jgi:hypothetical protein
MNSIKRFHPVITLAYFLWVLELVCKETNSRRSQKPSRSIKVFYRLNVEMLRIKMTMIWLIQMKSFTMRTSKKVKAFNEKGIIFLKIFKETRKS